MVPRDRITPFCVPAHKRPPWGRLWYRQIDSTPELGERESDIMPQRMPRNDASLRNKSCLITLLLLVSAPATSGEALAFDDQLAGKDQIVVRQTSPKIAEKTRNQTASLRVVDEQGRDVEMFDVVARVPTGNRTVWKHGVQGHISLDFLQRFSAANSIDLIVRAPNFITAIEHFGDSKERSTLLR